MYLDLFANTYRGIKAAHPELRVGGPATAQLAWLDVMVQGATRLGCPPDFVSSHLYPTDPWAHEQPLSHGRADFAKAISSAADIVTASAKKAGMATSPQLLITEFNCGLGMNCADAPFSASFIAHHALAAQRTRERVPFQSYW